MNHNFDYDNADRKELLERCERFEVALDSQHSLLMATFKERDTCRDLCAELLKTIKQIRTLIDPPAKVYYLSAEAITKAESILGESQ